MKSKLAVKILAVVLSISLLTTILYGTIASYLTLKSFNSYLKQEKGAREEALALWAAESYQNLGWDFVLYLKPLGFRGGRGMMSHGAQFNQERIIVADNLGTVYYDSDNTKTMFTKEELLEATPITVNSNIIGYLSIETPALSKIASLRESFNASLKRVSWISGIFASLIALSIGLLLSYDLIKRIQALNTATTDLIKGNFNSLVPVNGNDELAQLAEAFNKMVQKLAANERARQNLFNDVAHELRTPLAILRGNLEGMQLGAIKPTPLRIASLNDEIIRLTSLVRELQEIGLAEAGELKLNLTLENLSELLSDLRLNFEAEAELENIKLDFIYPDLDLIVDKNRLRQILINIISNAFRYAKNGRISLIVTEKENDVLFTITNSGPHIPAADLEHLFNRFYKTDPARTRDKSGSGLGLSIAKAYIEAHGGKIEVKNIAGGVQFSFTIPKINT